MCFLLEDLLPHSSGDYPRSKYGVLYTPLSLQLDYKRCFL